MYHWGGQKQFPTVITIFSAPNYCDFYNNKGAVIKFKVPLELFRTILLTSSSSLRTSTPTCCLTSWTYSSGVFRSWLRRFHRCCITWWNLTASTTRRRMQCLYSWLTRRSYCSDYWLTRSQWRTRTWIPLVTTEGFWTMVSWAPRKPRSILRKSTGKVSIKRSRSIQGTKRDPND